MAEELNMGSHFLLHEAGRNSGQRGFVLVTSLVMLGLLTLMSLAMFYSGRIATQTSSTAQSSTEAYYYAETAVHYISWALANDAEFDNHTYTGTYVAAAFGEPLTPAAAASVGDYNELLGYLWTPGPTAISDTLPAGTAGQLMYFDNSPMGGRHLCLQDASLFNNCVDVTVDPSTRVEPSMNKISAQLPRYIRLDIAADGSITPTIPSLPHHATPVVGQDIPANGAIIWLAAGDPNNANHDVEIYPLDPANAYGGTAATACVGGTLPNCPCDSVNDPAFATAQACDANSGLWLSTYNIVAYAVGYVNGKPSHMLRAVIQ
ncbi:MAG: hypothetical protein COW18_00700 [Zetaproteobacteria bacterium CG12_big_fil_rev_8_21_14_0_65_54_13]|nr:MAG: hypothetical protein COW18_00700 [Zetaproteobacteria bacterium CG12_big_fil_rev_8_21_14_0_65_54_13]PIX55337.1 MAG: hypothetical protein COZ50_03150 [Zetaproteobacteria bacterium CG_4_10_14_3_um_filter_54_28]PJA27277.1 MAG: hypothetical protein CO188_12640 [Zetaproteobacteria bacterium CG_4_9_14_3_um_filter_54_145]